MKYIVKYSLLSDHNRAHQWVLHLIQCQIILDLNSWCPQLTQSDPPELLLCLWRPVWSEVGGGG